MEKIKSKHGNLQKKIHCHNCIDRMEQ